ncbi:MAG: YMGG-like glycine zipper-containing protein [Halieaceae bacterium]|jgi:osmotically inducible lipoprotein OsmB|nr:YMGG-like glycine zipper-containing protein [Halieaceae bacterium]
MKTAPRYLMVAVLASSLGACSSMSDTEKRTLGGAGIGAASGALIGELATGQPLHGAAIGAAVGATSGWLYDRHKRGE